MHEETINTLLQITFCELSHNGALDSLLDKNVCIVTVKSNMFILPTDFPFGSHEKFSEFIPGTVL
jgi:hypothetical protein